MSRSRSSVVATLTFFDEEETSPRDAAVQPVPKQLRTEDFLSRTEYELATSTGESLQHIRLRKQEVLKRVGVAPRSLQELLSTKPADRFSLGILAVDQLLGGGLPAAGGELLEIEGPCAIGKTQLCMTVVRAFGRTHKRKVLLIDTCNGVDVSRLHQIFCHGATDDIAVANDLRNVSLVKANNIQALLHVLDSILSLSDSESFPLVIVDSLAHLIAPLTGRKNPTGYILADVVVGLFRQILRHGATNMIVTTFAQKHEDGSRRPSLGAWWGFTAHHILSLEPSSHTNEMASCKLAASSAVPIPTSTKALYVIGEGGVEFQ